MAHKIFKEEWVYSPTIHTLTGFDEDGHAYEIDLDRIKSWDSALSWIGHIFKKGWATDKVMRGLLDAFDHFYELDGAEHRKFTAKYGEKWLVFPKPEITGMNPGLEVTKPDGSKIQAFTLEELSKASDRCDADWERASYVRCVRAGLTG